MSQISKGQTCGRQHTLANTQTQTTDEYTRISPDSPSNDYSPLISCNILKRAAHPNIKNAYSIFPYPVVLFSFGDISCRNVCLLSYVIGLNGTQTTEKKIKTSVPFQKS